MKKTIKPEKISIIGGAGQMGKKFKKVLEKEGYTVLIADLNTKLSNQEVASQGDVIIITVPIGVTEKVTREILPFLKKDALLTDFTSVKIKPMELMLKNKNKNEILGGHPLFGPTADFKNQNIILCKGKEGKYSKWYRDFLKSLGLKIIDMTSEEHDRHMAVIQCLTHFSNLSLGSALSKINYDLSLGEKIATPVYKLRFYGVGRILAQNPVLYADIQTYNPFAKEVSKIYLEAVKELNDSVAKNKNEEFIKIFKKSQTYFGKFKEKSLKMTDKLIKIMK
jgi:prephenate dehydrogenase